MKKWLLVLLIFLVIVIASIYLFIPSQIIIQQRTSIPANPTGFTRAIRDDGKWKMWWPVSGSADSSNTKGQFYFNGYKYHILEKRLTTIVIGVSNEDRSIFSTLNFLSAHPDSVQLIWHAVVPASDLPVGRLRAYYASRQIDRDIKKILDSLSAFYANEDHIYDAHIRMMHVVDTNLIATSSTSKSYPSTDAVYGLIAKLRAYIAARSAKETGYPMLNISTTDSISYLTRVAIPVDRKLNSSGNIEYKWMLGGANIVVTEAKGGPHSINRTFQQLENYVGDHQRIAPAIPFQSLVTDRSKEPDSSKWVTRLFYPVM